MKKLSLIFLLGIGVMAWASVASIVVYRYAPLSWIEGTSQIKLGTTVTTINGSDTLSNSRTTINNNFANLNSGKLETTVTSVPTITTLSGLTSVGTIGTGVWQGTTIGVAYGGTGSTTLSSGQLLFGNGVGFVGGVATSSETCSSPLSCTGFNVVGTGGGAITLPSPATLNTLLLTTLGVGSTTPWGSVAVGSGGSITVGEYQPATSTNATISWKNGNQQLYRTGSAGTTIGFSNYVDGQHLLLVVCNPGSTAGAITFTGVEWAAATAPTQTTIASQCDAWSFIATMATTTLKIFGTAATGFN